MAVLNLASWWQQALVVTSLLANSSDFAATNMLPASISTTIPQYTPAPSVDYGQSIIPNIRDPCAIDAQTVCPGYLATQINVNDNGFSAQLSLLGDSCNVYGTDIDTLNLTVEYQAKSRLHVNIKPAYVTADNASWYALPESWVPAPQTEDSSTFDLDLAFSWTNSPTFGFNVTRRATDEVIFSTLGSKLVYENQFIEFATQMDEGYNLYGLGEVFRGLRLEPGLTRTIYAADAGDPVDRNAYGSHPFYLETKFYKIDPVTQSSTLVDRDWDDNNTGNMYTSTSHGVYLRNAHAQEILLGDRNVTWRSLGGEIDLYFFSGPSQPEVTSQYLHQIGLPAMQQYWTFGYHQCRWGYQNWSMTKNMVERFEEFEIPLETVWNDIDYMKGYRDFDNDPIRFSYEEGAKFLDMLHQNGQHYVPIVDAAIYIPNPNNQSDTYEVFDSGNQSSVFLLNPDGTLYIGQVWPGYTVFPDWLAPHAAEWWQNTVLDWHDKIPFDGLWIDMNEASSFCVGSCGSGNLGENPVHPWFKLPGEPGEFVYSYPEGFNRTNATEAASASAASSTQAAAHHTTSATATSFLRTEPILNERNVNQPPYAIDHIHGDLAVHAISPNATHHNGVKQYDVHNLYGHQLLQNTYAAIAKTQPGLRPFIIGRSTFVGSGNYSGHWGGDNKSQFRHMCWSIPQALSFSLFGIPMFGVDTCGFDGNSDEELCNRWMQLSAFFPFYRNHNTLGANSQEPYVWSSVTKATKIAMNIRFQLLPYLYTLFYHAHTRGDTVMRALSWEFPTDPSLASADRQFLLGPAVMVIPVLTQGDKIVKGVFPGLVEGKEVYYDWYNQSSITVPSKKNTTIDAPLGHIPVYIRGGNVIATQEMKMTTREARRTDWSLTVALGVDGHAKGDLYLDDGVSIQPESMKRVYIGAQVGLVKVDETPATKLRIDVFVEGNYTGLDFPLANITVLGVTAPTSSKNIVINDEIVQGRVGVEYCRKTQRLLITGLQNQLNGRVWEHNWSIEV